MTFVMIKFTAGVKLVPIEPTTTKNVGREGERDKIWCMIGGESRHLNIHGKFPVLITHSLNGGLWNGRDIVGGRNIHENVMSKRTSVWACSHRMTDQSRRIMGSMIIRWKLFACGWRWTNRHERGKGGASWGRQNDDDGRIIIEGRNRVVVGSNTSRVKIRIWKVFLIKYNVSRNDNTLRKEVKAFMSFVITKRTKIHTGSRLRGEIVRFSGSNIRII